MSVKCMAWVLEHSESRLSDRLVLLALAEYAHDDGSMAFPAVETLARKARVGETTCRKSLRSLEADGEIEPMGKTKFGTVIYRLLMGQPSTSNEVDDPTREGAADFAGGAESTGGQNLPKGGQDLPKGGQDLPPNRQEPSIPVKGGSAGASGRVEVPSLKVGRGKVKEEWWDLTARVLTEYNRQAGMNLRLLTSAGKPSEAAKRIYLRIRDYPDISFDEHADIIQRTLASRWWGSGAPTIGVVYGPNVFEDNIARPGDSVGDKRADKKDRDQRRLAAMHRLVQGGQDAA